MVAQYKTYGIQFVVDDFSVKYVTTADAHHIRNALLRHYEITTDWDRTVYSGITLDWDYNKRTCDISMPGYTFNVLNKFQDDTPKAPQHTPSRYVTPVYGAKMQYATQDETPSFRTNNELPSKKSLDPFYITHVRLTQQCLCPSIT
jgi:hypothetical protein